MKHKDYPINRYPHTQITYFDNGDEREIEGIIEKKKGRWIHLYLESGEEVIINPDRVLFIKIKTR